MAWKWFFIDRYRVSIGSHGHYGAIELRGSDVNGPFVGLIRFHGSGPLPDAAVSASDIQRFYGHLDFRQMTGILDLLRNERPLRFGWSKADPNQFHLMTGSEPVGEGEGL